MKIELGNGIVLELVEIPAGSFLMGSPENEHGRFNDEGPRHLVHLESFWMGKYPVTQSQWRQVASPVPMIDREINPNPSYFEGDNFPVEQVSWDDAKEFCKRLSAKTGFSIDLPSEAQWEYACRAGTKTPFHFGETISADLANYDGNYTYNNSSKGEYREQTVEVGRFPANRFGLYDMHGNVYEWCEDDWHDSYEGAPTDGSAWIDENCAETSRLLRGGSWYSAPGNCRSAYRDGNARDCRYVIVGFRVVMLP